MFSSLSVIDEAEYTFYTAFQDSQYKVTAHCTSLSTNLLFESEAC